jgi:ubiquinone/menaquinone biosynthesis C-methylase UbiE
MLQKVKHKPKAKDPLHAQARPGLVAKNFRRISINGFGDPYNAYPHSMTWFQDHLYVGTTRATLAYRGRQRAEDHPGWLGAVWPVKIPEGIWDIDLRAEIWRCNPAKMTWKKVFKSPLVEGNQGDKVPLSVAFRSMTSFQGRSDSKPVIYAPTMATYQTSAVMLRSADGVNFKKVNEEGLGFPERYEPRGVRALVALNDRLFTSPAVAPKGKRKSYNFPDTMIVLVTDDPARGNWQLACDPHFGDPNNLTAFQMATFNGYLYAGTGNIQDGFQIWKTAAEGNPPFRWKKVMGQGAYRGRLNQGAITMTPFRDSLYVGTGIQEGGYDRYNNVGPAAVEIIRLNPDDSWDLIMGEPRVTPEGLKVPLSSLGPGFGKPFAGYLWAMCEHAGWLYAGTFDWLMAVNYGRLDQWPEYLQKMLTRKRLEQVISRFGGFDIWRTRDGISWLPVTQNGFGNPFNIGARSMVSTPRGLFVGAANPFAPEVAVHRISGWNYEDNHRGGCEVWLGDYSYDGTESSDKDARAPVGAPGTLQLSGASVGPVETGLEKTIRQFYGGNGFRHFGYWAVGVNDAKSACECLMDEILALIPEKKGTILDIGCGRGETTRYLQKYFACEAITGITAQKKYLSECRSTLPDATFNYQRLSKLKLPAGSFDTVIWVKGLDTLGERRKLIRESYRVLKPGGRLVFFDMLPATKTKRPALFALMEKLQTPEAYHALLHTCGFQVDQQIDVTAETFEGFLKYTTRYFELKHLSAEMSDAILLESKAYLLMENGPPRQCLLVSAGKPVKDNEQLTSN